MANYFLVQVNNSAGYPKIERDHVYQNDAWSMKPRDAAHGEVDVGDILLVYCTQDVPNYGMTIALQAQVEVVSADNTTF